VLPRTKANLARGLL